MALVACIACGQPIYASCHDASCIDAVCPLCEYGPPDEAAAREAVEECGRREDASLSGDARPCAFMADSTRA